MLRPHTVLLVLAATLLAPTACGTLGTEGGGGENLPNRGLGPYTPIYLEAEGESQELYFIHSADADATYSEPAAIVRGGKLELYVISADADSRTLLKMDLDLSLSPGPAQPVLGPEDLPGWTEGHLASPSLIEHGEDLILAVAGGDGRGILFFSQKGDGSWAPGLAELRPDDSAAEAGGIRSPSLVSQGDSLLCYYAASQSDGTTAISLARSASPGAWERLGPVLEPGTDCVDVDGDPLACWDEAAVNDPEVRLALSGSGQAVFRLIYAGRAKQKSSLGFAASYDGLTFTRSLLGSILAGGTDVREPTNVFFNGRYLLFYEENVIGGRHGIGCAEAAGGHPSETF